MPKMVSENTKFQFKKKKKRSEKLTEQQSQLNTKQSTLKQISVKSAKKKKMPSEQS